MNETNTTRLSMDEVKQSQSLTDWKKVKGMTEKEIKDLAQADLDCQPTDDDFWEDAEVLMPDAAKISSNGC